MSENRTEKPNKLFTAKEIDNKAKKRAGILGIYSIAKEEDRLFWYLFTSFFLICFVYSVTRDLKDALLLENQEPTSISFLKTFGVPPISIIFSLISLSLLRKNSTFKVLTLILKGFGLYFMAFGAIFLTIKKYVEPNVFFKADFNADGVMEKGAITGFIGPLLVIINYIDSINFVATEIYGSVIFSSLSMTWLNETVTFNQIIRFLPLLLVGANIGLILSGVSINFFNKFTEVRSYFLRQSSIKGLFVIIGLISWVAVFFVNKAEQEAKVPIFLPTEVVKKKKKRSNLTEAQKNALYSPLLYAICFSVLAYGVLTNITEGSYKSFLKVFAEAKSKPTSSVTLQYNSYIQIIVGVSVLIMLLTPFKKLVQLLGYRFAGLVTPFVCAMGVIFVFGIGTYNILKSGKNSPYIMEMLLRKFVKEDPKKMKLGMELAFCVIFVSAIKTFKYAAFDICKELVSVKINPDYRPYVKAISDGMCGKFGKAVGSIYALIVTPILGTKDIRPTSIIAIPFGIIILLFWIMSILVISSKYNRAVSTNSYIQFSKKEGME